MVSTDYLRKTITTAGMAGASPESLPGVARYLADGWRVVGTRLDGLDLVVDIIKNPSLLGEGGDAP